MGSTIERRPEAPWGSGVGGGSLWVAGGEGVFPAIVSVLLVVTTTEVYHKAPIRYVALSHAGRCPWFRSRLALRHPFLWRREESYRLSGIVV